MALFGVFTFVATVGGGDAIADSEKFPADGEAMILLIERLDSSIAIVSLSTFPLGLSVFNRNSPESKQG